MTYLPVSAVRIAWLSGTLKTDPDMTVSLAVHRAYCSKGAQTDFEAVPTTFLSYVRNHKLVLRRSYSGRNIDRPMQELRRGLEYVNVAEREGF